MVKLAYVPTNLDLVVMPVHIGNTKQKSKVYHEPRDGFPYGNYREEKIDGSSVTYTLGTKKGKDEKYTRYTHYFGHKYCEYNEQYHPDSSFRSVILIDKKAINTLIDKVFISSELLKYIGEGRLERFNIDMSIILFNNACVIQGGSIEVIDTKSGFCKDELRNLGISYIRDLKSFYLAYDSFLYPEQEGDYYVKYANDSSPLSIYSHVLTLYPDLDEKLTDSIVKIFQDRKKTSTWDKITNESRYSKMVTLYRVSNIWREIE